MNNTEVILCILEGKKPDTSIFKQLKSIFFENRSVNFFYIGISIYNLYNKIISYQKDIGVEFVDIFPIIKNIIEDQKNEKEFEQFKDFLELKQNQISEIFLFFDYDGQDKDNSHKNPNTIDKMLELFNNETNLGKLYINYPMVESYKHPINNQIEIVNIFTEVHYKTYVALICDKKFEQVNRLTKDDWLLLFLQHLKASNYLFFQQFELPRTYIETQRITQLTIYKEQKQQYIEPNKQVMVLSSFSWFLLEYLGEELFLEWQNIDNQG